MKILRLLIKKKFVKLCFKGSNFQPIANKVRIYCLGDIDQRYKDATFQWKNLFQNLGDGRMHYAALHKIPTRTVVSSQFFQRRNLQKQRKIIKKATKGGTKTQSEIRNRFVKHETTAFPLISVVKDQFAWLKNLIFIRFPVSMLNSSKMNLGRKNLNHLTRFVYVDTNTTFRKIRSITSTAALSSFQNHLLCTLHSEVCSWF